MTNLDSFFSIYTKLHTNDIVDICISAFFLYYFLKYLTARPQRPILFFSASIGVAYLLSKFFSLTLVRTILDSLVTALMIIIAIVFQRDIRRFIEHMSAKLTGLKEKRVFLTEHIDQMIDIVSNLARKRIGSIFVFVGNSPVSNIVTGGKRLQTDIDSDIIESIFDSRTPSHDGAMVIDEGQITHIACQLPLSKGTQKPLNLGTRHSAILGLSERSDSLSVVTSEERGTISIAQNGVLLYDIGVKDLRDKMDSFFKKKSKKISTGSNWSHIFTRNIFLKICSIFIALTLWADKVYDPGSSQASVIFPVEVRNIPSGYKIEAVSSEKVTIRLSGPSNSINEIKKSPRKVILNYAYEKKNSKIFKSSVYHFNVPDGVIIHSYTPRTIKVFTSPVEKTK